MEPSGLHALWGGLNASTEKQVWDVAFEPPERSNSPSSTAGNRKLCHTCWGAAPPPPTVNCEPLACKVHSSHSDSLDGDLEALTTALHASSGT